MSKQVSRTVRKLVFERDNNRCVSCGAEQGLSIQHRINRQMGGSNRRDSVSSLITMCLIENQLLEADSRKARIARFNGWKLRTYEDPLVAPVWYAPEGGWFMLDDKGGRVPAERPVAVVDDVPF